jgi:hypothetical protein
MIITSIRASILCFLRMFFIIFAKFSSVCLFFMYSKSIITSWYFQFLSIKKAIIDKYDWRFEANQQFNVREILTRWNKCSNKDDSISFTLFMMWFLIVKKDESLTYEFKHWNKRSVSISSIIEKFWSITTIHRRNCVSKSSRVNTRLCNFVFAI